MKNMIKNILTQTIVHYIYLIWILTFISHFTIKFVSFMNIKFGHLKKNVIMWLLV
jgi:hypothetical protein